MYNQHNNTIKSFRKVYLFSILLLSISLNANASTYDENRNTIISNNDKNKVNASEHASNLITLAPETIPVGSLIIPMDNTLQGDGSEFNLKAYGALVRLLHANIPLKWAIRPGKTNGGIDFTALSTQVDPATGGTIGVSSSTSYIASAFIVSPDFRDAALEVIDNYNNTISDDINVYQLDAAPSFPASGQVDIYATLLHKPYAASLQNGKGSIHTGVYASAGLEENVHYEEVNDAASLTNSSCYTFANEPHASVSDSQITAVRNFVQNGGNFLAQCAGARAYDDDSSSATERLITSGGLVDESGEGGTITMNNSNADNPVVQIDGTISDEGGSLKAFTTTPITAGATDEELYATQTDGDNKLWGARINGLTGTYGSNGGFVFYLAGHKYGSSDSNGINGRRILLNALMLPPSRPTSCGFDIPISAPNLSIGDVTVDEGNSASFVLTLDNSYNEDIDVVLERINNTTTNADYNFTIPSTQPSVFTFTIPANTTTANIPFDAIDDGISELPETFNLNIQSANAGAVDITVTDPTGLGTINNINLPNVSISDDTDYEGATIILTVSLDGPYTQDVVVDFNVTDGTAIAPGDYTVPAITQVTIPSGSTSTTINVVTIVDPPTETTEFFNVNLTSALSGITLIPIVDNLGIGNITDNSLYTVSIDDVTVTEGNPANFTVTRTGNLVVGLPFPLHIDYEIIPNTATGGSVDYDDPPPPTPPTPPLTSEYQFIMPGNDLTATLTVPTISDNIYEGSENYTVRITKAYAVAFFFSVFELPIPITDSDGLGIILDDEPLPRVDINNVTVTEGNPANFQLSLVNPGTSLPITSSEDITVTFDVNNGTAIAGSDYTVPSQLSVVIPAGNSTANITIPTINDNIYELTENFTVNMTSAVTNITSTAITIGTNPGTGTITDNDPIPTISISGDTVDEGDLLDFLVTLSSPINTDVFYAFSLADNTATTPADYIVPTTLAGTIFAGSTQSTITVETVDDFISEPTEDMLANIDNTIAIIGITPIPITITTPQATGIINDNDIDSDLSLTKSVALTTDTDSSGSISAGDTVTFTVTINNAGPTNATGVGVGDTVPDGYTSIASISNGGSFAGGIISWSALAINAGANLNLTYTALVTTTGNYTNFAEITAADQNDIDSTPDPTPDTDPPAEDDEASATASVEEIADLSLTKNATLTTDADSSGGISAGDTVTFTVTVNNAGPNNATGVGVGDTVPDGYTSIASISNGGSFAGGIISWSALAINASANLNLTYTAVVTATGNYTNFAEITASDQTDLDSTPDSTPDTDPPAEDDETSETPAVQLVSDISVNKSVILTTDADGSTNPTPGDTVTFTVTVTNNGPNDATGVQVTDLLPNGYTIVGSPTASQGSYTVGSGLWDIGALNNAANATLNIIATINATGDYVNVAELTASNNFDPNSTPNNNDPTEDDQDDADPGVSPVSNIDVNKSVILTTDADGSTNPTPGDTVTFTVTVTNNGPNDATGVQVTDQVPNGYTIVGAPTASQGTYTVGSGLWDIGTINNAANATLTIVATINATGDYINVAELTASNNFDPNSTPNNNDPTEDDQDDADPGVSPVSNIDVNKSVVLNIDADGSTNPTPGDTVTFTVTVTNSGPNDATGVQVTDQVPNGYTIVGAPTASQGTYTVGSGLWDIGTINNAANATLTIVATINATGDYVNVAELTASNNFDPNSTPNNNDPTEDDQDDADPGVSPVSNIDVNKSVVLNIDADGSTNPTPGDTVTFTVTVTNSGPNDATGVQVTDQVPNGYTIVGAPTASQGTYTVGSGLWDIGTINNAANATLTIVATINATGDYINVAELTASNNFDPNSTPNNNDPTEDDQSEVDPGVSPVSNINVNKSVVLTTDADGSTNPTPGDTVTFTVTVNNSGPNDATGVQVTDQVPNGYTIVGTPTASQGTYTVGSGLWDIGTINNAANATLTIVATINATGDYVNVAELTASNNFDPNSTPNNNDPTEDDQSEVDPGVSPVSNIDVNKSVVLTTDADGSTNPTPGDTVTFTVTVTNSGPNDATGVQVTDQVPNGYTIIGTPTASQGTYTVASGLWDIGTINNAANATLTIVATINATGDYVNVAELTASNNFDPNSTPNNNDPTEDDQSEVDPGVSPVSDIEILKSVALTNDVDGNSVISVGDTITFSITLSNAGPNDATGIAVGDTVPDGYSSIASISNGGSESGGLISWSGLNVPIATPLVLSYTVVVTDTGNYTNFAEITASDYFDPDSTPDSTPDTDTPTEDDETSFTPSIPELTLTKTSSVGGDGELGDTITYTFTVENTGNSTISNIIIDDPLTGSVDLPIIPSTLAAGEVGIATATYIITQNDIDQGEVINSATVVGEDPNGDDVIDISDNGDETVDDDGDGDPTNDVTVTPVEKRLNLALTKTGNYIDTNNDGFPNSGDEIHYTFTVENVGNVDVTNIILTDPLSGIEISGQPIDLSIGEIDSDTFTATYILTQEDILAGQVTNQATVTGIGPIGDTVIDLSDDPNDPTDIDLDGDGDFEDETIVTVVSDDGIIIYEGISPDNDGKNDDFRIVGLNNFPNNTLNIFNRWGVLVFEQDRYEQPESKLFNGVSDGRLTIKRGDKLPTGTYYYILKYTLPSGKIKSRAGYFYLNR